MRTKNDTSKNLLINSTNSKTIYPFIKPVLIPYLWIDSQTLRLYYSQVFVVIFTNSSLFIENDHLKAFYM